MKSIWQTIIPDTKGNSRQLQVKSIQEPHTFLRGVYCTFMYIGIVCTSNKKLFPNDFANAPTSVIPRASIIPFFVHPFYDFWYEFFVFPSTPVHIQLLLLKSTFFTNIATTQHS